MRRRHTNMGFATARRVHERGCGAVRCENAVCVLCRGHDGDVCHADHQRLHSGGCGGDGAVERHGCFARSGSVHREHNNLREVG